MLLYTTLARHISIYEFKFKIPICNFSSSFKVLLIMKKEYQEDLLAELFKISSSIENDVKKLCPNYSFGDLNINQGIVQCNDYINGKKLFNSNNIHHDYNDDEINIDDIDDIDDISLKEKENKIKVMPEMDNTMRESLSLDWIRYEAESLESMIWDRIQYLKKKSNR